MCKSYIIRHGQSIWNQKKLWAGGNADIPLTDEGRRQAAEACENLKQYNFEIVSSSPLIRAKETAAIIAEGLGIPLEDPIVDLNERDLGSLSGMNSNDVKQEYPIFYNAWASGVASEIEDGESWDRFITRIRRGVNGLVTRSEKCLVVSHMGVLRAIEFLQGVAQSQHDNLKGVWVDQPV